MEIDLASEKKFHIGVVSDTHGKLSKRVRSELAQVDLIIHAGDFDTASVWENLAGTVPVAAAKGNMDWEAWAKSLKPSEMVRVGPYWFYILHDLYQLDLDPRTAGIDVVISGHTHHPKIERKDGVLYVNPGSASFPRGVRNSSIAIITVSENHMNARLVCV